jgi:hypothetical protein
MYWYPRLSQRNKSISSLLTSGGFLESLYKFLGETQMFTKNFNLKIIPGLLLTLLMFLNFAHAETCPDPRLITSFRPVMRTYNPVDLMVYGPAASQSWCTLNPGSASAGRAPCSLHHVVLPNASFTPRDSLFVFLPGSNMEPDKHDLVLGMAAYAGYRTIGLSYDNTTSVGSICETSTCGDNCQGKAREEAILGLDRTNLLAIEKADSILERLYTILAGLHEEDIADGTNDYGWDAYFVPLGGAPQLSFNNIVWSKIVVGGFSQGAGHAAFIAKEVVVKGIIVIDGADDECVNVNLTKQPADWILDLADASANRPRYAMGHARTQTPPYVAPATWLSLGFGISGVDDLDNIFMEYPPYNAAMTSQLPVNDPDCGEHASMARDECMPTNPISEVAAKKPEKAHLYSEYLLRFCAVSQ